MTHQIQFIVCKVKNICLNLIFHYFHTNNPLILQLKAYEHSKILRNLRSLLTVPHPLCFIDSVMALHRVAIGVYIKNRSISDITSLSKTLFLQQEQLPKYFVSFEMWIFVFSCC